MYKLSNNYLFKIKTYYFYYFKKISRPFSEIFYFKNMSNKSQTNSLYALIKVYKEYQNLNNSKGQQHFYHNHAPL